MRTRLSYHNISGCRDTAPGTLDLITRIPSHPQTRRCHLPGPGLCQPLSPGCSADSLKQAEACAQGVVIAPSPCTSMESERRHDHRSAAAHQGLSALLSGATVEAGRRKRGSKFCFPVFVCYKHFICNGSKSLTVPVQYHDLIQVRRALGIQGIW